MVTGIFPESIVPGKKGFGLSGKISFGKTLIREF